MRKRSRDAGSGSHDVSDAEVMVRRSSIAACVTCGLCGCFLRDATAISECLHAFCGKCISDKFKDEDNKRCPTCNIDLGCDPKLRADRSLQCISSVIFPTKRKMEEFSSLHPELVSLPSLTSRADEAYHSGYKMGAHLVTDTMNTVDPATEGRTALSPASQSEAKKNIATILEMIEVYIGQAQASEAKTARRRKFENKRAQRAAACERAIILEDGIQREFETFQNTAKILQRVDAYIGRIEALEADNARLRELLEAEKSNTRELNEQLGKTVSEKNKVMTELQTNNDGLAKIQGCIHKSLTARISRLKGVAATTNLGHYQHLLARMDDLGQVKEHLPKMLETIEVTTSLSAYSLAAAMLIRLRAYHGDDFDLQRLVMPLHLNREEYARIRNAVDPLAAKVAQKYRVCGQ